MAIRYILGRAGSGKTARCLDEIRSRLASEPEGPPLVLLVPEQATFQAEHALVSTPGLNGIIRAQALSFRRLAYRVMQETGGIARILINESGKNMLLHDILHRHQDELRHFRMSSGQIGLIGKLNRICSEFLRYALTPDALEAQLQNGALSKRIQANPGLEHKLRDLLLVYRAYKERLSEHYTDSEHLLTKLAESLAESAYIREAEIWIDGFFGFTPQELQVIGELMRWSRGVTVTLCLDRDYGSSDEPDELDLFHPTARTLIRLKRLAEGLGVPQREAELLHGIPPRFRSNPMLMHLEQSFDKGPRAVYRHEAGERSRISVCSAVSRRAEVEGTAREIVRLVRDEGCRWRDIAVMVRNMDGYGDLLAVTFADYGIPAFLDHKRPVLHHPLVELIRSSLEVVTGRWGNDAVFRCAKTDLLFPIEEDDGPEDLARLRDAVSRLENYVLASGVQGTRWTEKRPWTYRIGSMLDDVQEANARQDEAFFEEINRLRRMIAAPLAVLDSSLRAAETAQEMAAALFRFLERIRANERLELWSRRCLGEGKPEKAREHAQVWGSVVDLLDQIAEMMGEEKLTLDRFAGLVESGLESVTLALVPPSLDQVLVGTMDRTRSGAVRHLFVLGANDGVLPAKPDEDGVLSEPERELLAESGLQLAESSRRKLLDESFLLYAALTAPSETLWVSYPLADEEGKALMPAEIVKRLKAMFPAVRERLLTVDPPPAFSSQEEEDPTEYAANPQRALTLLGVQLRQWMLGAGMSGGWWDVYNWMSERTEWRDKLHGTLSSLFFTNDVKPLDPFIAKQLYGESLRASVSRMEKFAACPFAQFASHGLKLNERQLYRLDAPDIGQLFHAALSRIAIRLGQEGISWGDLDAEQCFERAEQAVDELAPKLQGEILLSSKRYGYIARKLKQIVGRASAVLSVHSRSGQFVPVGLEIGFGPGEPLPPLEFVLDNGSRMEIVGRIDRIDRADSEQGVLLRVIDYKSSQTALRLSDVFYAQSLQLLTYLDVVVTYAEHWLGTKAKPAGVLYFHVHNPLISNKNALSAEEAEAALLKRFKMKGLVLEDADAVRLMDGELRERNGYSRLIPVALKADGGFYKSSSVFSERQWEQLRGYVRSMIRRIGNEIASGVIDIRPARSGAKLACAFCPYKPVCQFEPAFEGNGYKRLRPLDKETVWQQIAQAVQGAADAAAAREGFATRQRGER